MVKNFKFQGVILFSENPVMLVDFYKKVFNTNPDWSGGNFTGFNLGDCALIIGPHSQVSGKNKNPERIMFNLETTDIEGEFDRIKNIGATIIAKPYTPGEELSMKLATFADPDNNFFQIGTPVEM